MRQWTRTRRRRAVTLVATAAVVCLASPALAQGGSNCTVSVLNRTVTQNADGSWVLPNVPANFGPVRARVTCVINGETVSGESDPFVVPANGVVNLPPLRFGQTTPIPTALTLAAPSTTFTQAGQTIQLVVTARYSNNSTRDVTAASAFTQYTVSNPAIATGTADGLVRAVKSGTVLIQATHEGASGMTSMRVVLGGGSDTDGDGIPDADEVALGMNPASAVDAMEDFDRDDLTNREEFLLGTGLRVADTDADGLKDGDERSRGTNPLLRDSDGDGFGDGLEVELGTDPLNPNSVPLAGALTSVTITPSVFTLTFNTIASDVSVQLKVTGNLKDGSTIDLTSTARGTNYTSSNLTVCNFSAVSGRVFAGVSGGCTVTATVAGFSATATGTVTTFAPTALSSVALGGPGNGVDVSGDYVYVAAGAAGLQVVGVANRSAPQVVATLNLQGTANDVKIAGQVAFVAAGAAGLHVVDISNPLMPKLLGSIDTPGNAVDVRPLGTFAYVADGSTGLAVVDVANPAAPRVVGGVATAPGATGVDVDGTLAVVTTGSAGVRIVNVANPANPVVVGTVDTPGDARDVVVNGGFGYVADYTGSLRAIDFRNPAAPVLAGTTTQALGGILSDVARMDTFAFGADEFFVNGVPIVDVSDAATLRPRARLDFPGDTSGLGIAVDGSYVYLGTNTSRLYIGQYRRQQDLNGIPPTVTISAPPPGTTFVEGETIPVTVSATDDLAVTGVTLQVNGNTVGTDTTAPYQFNVTAPTGGAATLVLGATAGDLGNNTGVASDVVLNVIPDPLTTVQGRVVTAAAVAVAGAVVSCAGMNGVTLADGRFSLVGVPTVRPVIQCAVRFIGQNGIVSGGISAPRVAVRGGVTAIGDVAIAPVPIITSIAPKIIDATRPPVTLAVTGDNLVGATFSFAPDLGAITVGVPQIGQTGVTAVLPVTVSSSARGRFTLVGANAFGAGGTDATPGNTLTVINAQDDGDSDGDGFPDGFELLYGSDPTNPTSRPNLSARGEVIGPAFSVVNSTLPFTVEKSATAWFSVLNTTLPFTVEKTATTWFSVRNTSIGPTQWTVVSPAVSVCNLQCPAPIAPAPDAATGKLTASPLAPSISLDGVSSEQRLVEGQTLVIRGNVSGGDAQGSVTFRVNGAPLFVDTVAPYALTFTVPAGVPGVTFGATFVDASGRRADARAVSVRVDRDTGTSIVGRVVDATGVPIANARVELLSDGLTAEYFEPSQPLQGLPDLTDARPVRTTRVTALNMRGPAELLGHDAFGSRLAPNYAARFTGAVSIPAAGAYTFMLGANEGARLTLDGRLLIDMPSPAFGGYQESSGEIQLQPGLVPLEVTLYESNGNAALQLSVTTPDGQSQVVQPGQLVPTREPFAALTNAEGLFVLTGVPMALENVRLSVVQPFGGSAILRAPFVGPLPAGPLDVGVITVSGGR